MSLSSGLKEAALYMYGAPTEQGHEGRGMGSTAMVNRRKLGGTTERAMLARGQAPGAPGGVDWSSSSRITGCVESACERMMQKGLSMAKHESRHRAAVVG